jgi:hypothetical protein
VIVTVRLTKLLPLAVLLVAGWCHAAHATIVVYDLRWDFSNSSNPNGTWSYWKGNTPLTHYTPVPGPLAPAVSGGYWGDAPASLNGAIMLSTANGSAAPPWSDNDFIANHVLVRTTDPSTGGATNVRWTAPSAGTFTYSGGVWYANPQAGPFGNSFSLSLNNGPLMESGTAGIGNDFNNGVGMVNGLFPTNVNAGDVVTLELVPNPLAQSGSLAGVSFTIDFQPVPEPRGLVLMAAGMGSLLMLLFRKRRLDRYALAR